MSAYKLLIDEPPMMVLPTLAIRLGLNEAVFLQQLHYLLRRHGKTHDGREWLYSTYGDWTKVFPFWSESTVRRIVGKLETAGIVLSETKYNRMKMDQTKWYSIDYAQLEGESAHQAKMDSPSDDNTSSSGHNVNLDSPSVQNERITSVQNEQANNHKEKDNYTREDERSSSEVDPLTTSDPSSAQTLQVFAVPDEPERVPTNSTPQQESFLEDEAQQPAPTATPVASHAEVFSQPSTYQEWLEYVRGSSNKAPPLLEMFATFFPQHEKPKFSYVAKVARDVGGAGMLVKYLWDVSTRDLVGDDPLAYIYQTHRNRTARVNGYGRTEIPPPGPMEDYWRSATVYEGGDEANDGNYW